MNRTETRVNRESRKAVLRIDNAHRMATDGGGEPPLATILAPAEETQDRALAEEQQELALAAVTRDSGDSTEQLHLQAGQLARHLRDRRREIDRREAQTNARIAQLENELRLSRLWLREQSQEFEEREAELRKRLDDYEARVAARTADELSLGESRRQFAEETRAREDQLVRRERQVLESQQRLADEAARLQTLRDCLEHERLEVERQQAEQLVRNEQDHVWERKRREVERLMEQQRAEVDGERVALAARARSWQEERSQQQQALHHERQQLEQRQLTVEKVRSDVLRLHREALEMRLVAEQLWAQLGNQLTPAELTAAVSKLHQQLADEFRFATQDLESQRSNLQELIDRLEQKQQQLSEQRKELMEWFRRRQTELAQQAADLAEHQQTLAHERQVFRDQQQHWYLDGTGRATDEALESVSAK